ncbi:hypothetical protein [Nonlabens ulvanivorans]|jgi:hypothetical protein|nr:hypothetical protein [Nonlabens ulvanivorans]WOI24156.1 hypothetical protein R1T42_06815 [Nonlabens ulvanivorans]
MAEILLRILFWPLIKIGSFIWSLIDIGGSVKEGIDQNNAPHGKDGQPKK